MVDKDVVFEVLGKVSIPEANMKDLIWVDRKSGEIRSTPFKVKRLTDEERTKRVKAKAEKSEAFAARVIANAQKAKAEAEATIRKHK